MKDEMNKIQTFRLVGWLGNQEPSKIHGANGQELTLLEPRKQEQLS